MEQFVEAVESTFKYLGGPLAAIYAVTILLWWLRNRSPVAKERLQVIGGRVGLPLSPLGRKIVVSVLSVLAAFAYVYCTWCTKSVGEKAEHDAGFWHILVSFSIKVLPFFVAGCVFSAIIAKIVHKRPGWLPKSMLSAGVFASLLPICSCAAVPFSYSLLATRRIALRAVVCFMVVVPVLNPFVIPFAYGVLGWQYTMWRIVSIFALGMIAGLLVERFAGDVDPELPEGGCTACKGCTGGIQIDGEKSAWDSSFELMAYLAPYIIIGTTIGALVSVYMPPYIVGEYLSAKFSGLLLAGGIGLPLFLCSGEDILILEPLMRMGLPMGHAIALTLAGNGICISSIALLVPLFGKRATWIIATTFLVGSIAVGLLINVVNPLIA
ncbi:MAG: permease [Actinomycetota bacterium]|jgi:uncharacterized membrane protein YraQ (UPF0718 family)|nr:permease [Actinomycetota bacterium]